MRAIPHLSALIVAMALLPACSKPAEPGAEAPVARKTSQEPFQRDGELLTVNVDAMPRPAFIAKMAELTGVKITAEGDNNQTVTVHAVDASLRKVLSMAIADAPYAMSMQYTNLQDSFPASVNISRYQKGAAAQQPAPTMPLLGAAAIRQPTDIAAQPAPAGVEEDTPDFADMPSEERLTYFMAQPKDDQVSIIFDMEPTSQDAALMAQLMVKSEISSEVKIEMLDSLSNGEYDSGAPAIKSALDSTDPEIAAKAAEVLAGLGSAKDIPALKAVAEKTDNEDVRTAANDAIESLQE